MFAVLNLGTQELLLLLGLACGVLLPIVVVVVVLVLVLNRQKKDEPSNE